MFYNLSERQVIQARYSSLNGYNKSGWSGQTLCHPFLLSDAGVQLMLLCFQLIPTALQLRERRWALRIAPTDGSVGRIVCRLYRHEFPRTIVISYPLHCAGQH